MKKKKHKRASDMIAIIIMIVAIGVFTYAVYQLYLIFSEYRAGEKEYEGLREFVQTNESGEGESDSEHKMRDQQHCPISPDFQALKSINPDIAGWIYIEAIPTISYPIVQGTDNEYYLNHTVEMVPNSSASIFMDYRNAADFSDSNTIIYGHNMKNQSMFGALKKMKNPEVYETSQYIWILTPDKQLCYEIFSVRDISENDDIYHLLPTEPETFKRLLENYRNESEVENDIVFDGTEQIITLSTCTVNDVVRCVVQAVRKEF